MDSKTKIPSNYFFTIEEKHALIKVPCSNKRFPNKMLHSIDSILSRKLRLFSLLSSNLIATGT